VRSVDEAREIERIVRDIDDVGALINELMIVPR
jgi:hypothetical protein